MRLRLRSSVFIKLIFVIHHCSSSYSRIQTHTTTTLSFVSIANQHVSISIRVFFDTLVWKTRYGTHPTALSSSAHPVQKIRLSMAHYLRLGSSPPPLPRLGSSWSMIFNTVENYFYISLPNYIGFGYVPFSYAFFHAYHENSARLWIEKPTMGIFNTRRDVSLVW